MNSLTVVDIRVFNLNGFMLRIINSGIYLEKISYNKNILRCKMYTDDVAKLQKYYKLTIVKSLNFTTIVSAIKRNLLPLISALIGLLLFLILISITVEVNIMSQNDELNKRLAKSLEEQGIKRFSFKKNINELTKIKKQLEEQYIQEIEWLEIKENGMQYIVTLEERKIATPNTEEAYCNVYATTDGIVTRIIARKGNVIASENKYVRAGDILRSDILLFDKKDLEEILNLIGVNDKTIINSFEQNREAIKNTRNEETKSELTAYFQNILNIIDRYLEEYNIRYSNQVSFESTKVEKYKKYINLFSEKEFDTLFDESDFEELKALMSECSLEPLDKIEILKYINLQNITFKLKGKKDVEDFDLKSHIYFLVSDYLNDDEYVSIVRKEMPYIDYETLVFIPKEGIRIAKKHNLDQAKTIKTLVSLAINSLYLKYEYFIEMDDSNIEIDSLKDAITMLEGFFVDREKVSLDLATALIVENEEYLNKYANEAETYLDKTVSEILELGFTENEAVILKTIPILKGIKETIDIIPTLDGEEKKERLNYLEELMDMYNETKTYALSRIDAIKK